jgi:hypothetical protein
MPAAVTPPSANRHCRRAIISLTTSSRRWCYFPLPTRQEPSSPPPLNSGRPAASTPIPSPDRCGTWGRYPTRAERQRPRLGLWPRTGAQKQRPYRRQHLQCQPRGLRCQHRQPDRRQSAYLMCRRFGRRLIGPRCTFDHRNRRRLAPQSCRRGHLVGSDRRTTLGAITALPSHTELAPST